MQRTYTHRTGIYRSKDPIANLRIKLTLQKLNSLIQVSAEPHHHQATTATPSAGQFNTYTIEWQQKRFGRHELQRYADISQCRTDLHKKYHHQIITQQETGAGESINKVQQEVFTYVHEDGYQALSGGGGGGASILPNSRWAQHRDAIQMLQQNCELMFVMGHLDDDRDEETELFVLCWCPDTRVLSVYPDFNDLRTGPYLHEINSNNRYWYQYALEDVSAVLSKADAASRVEKNKKTLNARDEKLLVRQIAAMSITNPTSTITANFCKPPASGMFVMLLLELISAEMFDCDRMMYVRFTVHLPKNCELMQTDDKDGDSDQQLTASTPTLKHSDANGVWRFGYTHELNLLCTTSEPDDDEPLRISYEILSALRWGSPEDNNRSEGCTVQMLALQPGTQRQRLACYSDQTSSGRGWLSRLQQRNRGLASGGSMTKEFMLSAEGRRCGMQTMTTGYLNVSTRIVRQRAAINAPSALGMGALRKGIADRRQIQVPVISVAETIAAYERAKQRLLAGEKNLKQNDFK